MDSFTKAMRPSKLESCIENITRTLAQRTQDGPPQSPTSTKSMYKTEPYQSSSDGSSSLKMKIRKVSSYHTPEELKPYECPICHKRISNQANLRTHIRTHTGDKPHRCGICGKSFSRNGTLQTHLTIHSGVKLYKCEICGREIRDRGNLSKHMKIHLTNVVAKREPGTLSNFSTLGINRENGLDYSQRNLKREVEALPTSSQMELFQKEIYALNSQQIRHLEREIGQFARAQIQAYGPNGARSQAENTTATSVTPERRTDTKTNETLKLNMFAKLEMKRRDPSSFQKANNTSFQEPEDNVSGASSSHDGKLSHPPTMPMPQAEKIYHTSKSMEDRNNFTSNLSEEKIEEIKQSYASHLQGSKMDYSQDLQQNKMSFNAAPQDKVSYTCGLCAIVFTNTDSYFTHMMAHARDQTYNQRGPEYIDDRSVHWTKTRKPVNKEPEQPMLTQEEREMLALYERELEAYRQLKLKGEDKLPSYRTNQSTSAADDMEQSTCMPDDQTAVDFSNTQQSTLPEEQNIISPQEEQSSMADENESSQKSNFKCGICGNVYPTKDSFEDHISIHKVDKPYQCTICLEQFKELRFLQKHIRSHRGLNPPFWCEKCGREFSQSIFLIEHLQRHADLEEEQLRSSNDESSSSKIPQQPTPQGDDDDTDRMFIALE